MYFRIIDMTGEPIEGVSVSYKLEGNYYVNQQWKYTDPSVDKMFPTKSSGGFSNAKIEKFTPKPTVARGSTLKIHIRFYKEGYEKLTRTLEIPHDESARAKNWNKRTEHWIVEMEKVPIIRVQKP